MNYVRFLMLPFALLYGIVVFIRNKFYDLNLLPSEEFKQPIIAIGNLTTGGTGKSPMTEYLIRLLKENYNIATLSRGYGRNTSGFVLADEQSTSFQIGDEPLQFKKKFKDVTVAVDESRRRGIHTLKERYPDLQIILLDDAFQHRSVKVGMNILLTEYNNMFYDDFLLPSGTLREWPNGKQRADIIIVTKTPPNITPVERKLISKKINPDPHQHVFFSFIKYGEPKAVYTPAHYTLDKQTTVVVLSGIQSPKPLEDYLKEKVAQVIPIQYPDHHEYTIVEVTNLADVFKSITTSHKIIITTEKDAMRLDKPGLIEILQELPLYYIPIETVLEIEHSPSVPKSTADSIQGKREFDKIISEYITRSLKTAGQYAKNHY